MASLGGEQIISSNIESDSTPQKENQLLNTGRKTPVRNHEEKLKIARERQNEERQRKIEELKAQAEAAQKYREQKEEERKRRIEDLRSRENDKRHQVEERKRAIEEAEKERREYILRKNQDRETRIETRKRSERGSIAFAFGSSTPRLLEPADFGTVSPSVYWGHRRSTSITNVAYTGASLSRRSSERELAEGSKKRATSAGGAERHDEDIVDTHQIYRTVARRKTDLMPTIPSPRDTYFGSKSSLSNTPRTPGRAVSMNRLDQLAQPIRRNGEHIRAIHEREKHQHHLELLHETEILRFPTTEHASAIGYHSRNGGGGRKSMSRSMTHLATAGAKSKSGHSLFPLRKMDACKSMTQLNNSNRKKLHVVARHTKYDRRDDISAGSRSGDVTPGGSINTSRPGSAMSTSTTMSTSGYVHRRSAPAPRKPRPVSIAGTGVSLEEFRQKRENNKPPTPKVQSTPKRMSMSSSMTSSMTRVSSVDRKSSVLKKDSTPQKSTSTPSRGTLSKASSSEKLRERSRDLMSSSLITASLENPKTKEEKNALNTVKTESTELIQTSVDVVVQQQEQTAEIRTEEIVSNANEEVIVEPEVSEEKKDKGTEKEAKKVETKNSRENSEIRELSAERPTNEMTSSMMSRSKITTEEEAKAALAERRRLARVEAERLAELERQRLEAEEQAEFQRQVEEEERQRKFEEESLRMAEEQRRAEEERLKQAIEEAQKREEEERLKREDDEKLKIEREEADKKAKEDAEKQKIEVAERLKREEKEREERRKRVEAIMLRTRKAGAAATPNSTPTKENNDTSKNEHKDTSSVQNSNSTTNASPIHSSDNENHKDEIPINTNTKVEIVDATPKPLVVQEQPPIVAQETYEQSVLDKETALMNSFANLIIDENAKNLQNVQQTTTTTLVEVTNGKLVDHQNDIDMHNTVVANGNGHFDIHNKKDTNNLVDVPSTEHLIDVSNESQQITNAVNFNNNNSLLATTATLVTADSHENKEISLL